MEKKRKGGRPKRPSSRRKDSWEDRESKDMRKDSKRYEGSSNDPKWYATDPALLRDSASIPFSWPLGQRYNQGSVQNPVTGETINNQSINIPGVLVEYVAPSFGAYIESDALNVAAANMYTFVRHTNAGHSNYDPNDLMIYVMGMTQVYSYINFLERLYGMATLYDQRNRYIPDVLFKAQGVDGDSIKQNLANFRYEINVLINKVSSIAVPATMTIFLRQAMLYAYLYSEGESIKDQLYMYAPTGFYKFHLNEPYNGGSLVFEPLLNLDSPLSWRDLINYGTSLFNAIWAQEDFGIMSGDILKSYGSNILSLSSLEEVIPFAPVLDPMVLHQMKNATPVYYDGTNWAVFQDMTTNRLVNQQYIVHNGTYQSDYELQTISDAMRLGYNKVLTLDSSDPTPEMVIEATRMMSTCVRVDHDLDNRYIVRPGGGAEVVTDVVMWNFESNGSVNRMYYSGVNYVLNDSTGLSGSAHTKDYLLWVLLRMKAFKYAPCLFVPIFANSEDRSPEAMFKFEEVDNFAVLDTDDINKMHTAALLNMLNVPNVAKNSKV